MSKTQMFGTSMTRGPGTEAGLRGSVGVLGSGIR